MHTVREATAAKFDVSGAIQLPRRPHASMGKEAANPPPYSVLQLVAIKRSLGGQPRNKALSVLAPLC